MNLPRIVALLVAFGSLTCYQAAQAATQLSWWGAIAGTPPVGATNLVAVAGGDGHIVALRADGKVFAWGQNDYGQAIVPPDVTNAVRIGAGSTHTLALLDDGTVRFWGEIYSTGVTNPPAYALANMVALAPGGTAQHVLSVRSDGAVAEWGNSSYGLPNVPVKATNVVDAAVASFHSVVLRADGSLVAWGQYYPFGTPVVPANASNVVAVAAGFSDDLALRADGSLIGWGAGPSDTIIPTGATNISAIACGGSQLLALRRNGQLFSWLAGGQTNALPSGLSNVVAIAETTTGNLAIMANDGPPLMGRMPHNPVAAGTTARFRPLVISTTPLSYQWLYNGTNLPGATGAALVLTNAQPAQGGTYTLVVTNLFGAVTNSDLSLSVPPLLIQVPPQSQTVAAGTNATLGVTAFGQGTFTYQWQTNRATLPGATNSSLVLTNVQLSQAGTYSVVVSNSFGTVTSSNANLGVVPLFITAQPQSQSTYVGGQATFNVGTAGTGPYTYQWLFYGTNILSATNNPFVLTNAQLSDGGPYSVAVSNAYGAVQSFDASLAVVPILLTLEPQGQAGFLDQTITFTVAAQASLPLAYQWQFNGADLPGATTSGLTLTNCQYNQSGTYTVVINDSAATTNSAGATLAIAQAASWGLLGQASVPGGVSNVLTVSGNSLHSLALKSDGTVVRWGDNTNVPAGLTNVVAIAAGSSHDLALIGDGTIAAWGLNGAGQTNVPNGLTNVVSVAAGNAHSLALDSTGKVIAWGSNANGQTNVPPDLTNVVAIAAGGDHSLALRGDGTVVAWGYNGSGQTNVPPGLSNVVAIAGGSIHSLALLSDGQVVVWGSTGYGIPNVPASATNVVAIAAGLGHCLVLKSDGSVLAWGYSYDGETAVPPGLVNVVGIGAGLHHSLAIVSDGNPRPQAMLTKPAWGAGGFSLSVPSRSGKVYLLQYKNSLSDSNWTGLPLVPGNGSSITLADPTATGPQRFYQVRLW